MTGARTAPPPSSAKAVLLTTLGEFVLPHGGAAWTSTLIDSLGVCAIDERNARQALLRLAKQNVVRSQRDGRKARWHLTDDGRRLLTDGTNRIYSFGTHEDRWDGKWLVVLCSVPEEQRAKRHRLRTQLEFAGFGFIGPGVAVTPDLHREPAANTILKNLGLLPGAIVLCANTGEIVDDGELLHRAWDLNALGDRYRGFIAAFARRRPRGERAGFRALVELVHAWRGFPFVDPEIPRQLLAPTWVGDRAKALFDELHAAWSPGANAWYEARERAEQ
jgi:phenylacetic acid degradation operon negative regulatory protein